MKTAINALLQSLKTNGKYDKFKLSILQFVILFIVLFVYGQYLLYFDKAHVLDINSATLVTERVIPGGTLVYNVDFCKLYNIHGTVAYQWDNDYSYSGLSTNEHIAVGCYNRNIVVYVPSFLPSGEYRLEIEYIHRVNALALREELITLGPFIVE